ncbi:hypothetical protein [Pseudomonas sp. DSP3-2-2]|uniref:hypothetical protein n=1 Tax=unclassified Pseudomonas TaxID=196821 RepID=UPI003CF65D52
MSLGKQVDVIVSSLCAQAEALASQVSAANRQAEEEQKQWERQRVIAHEEYQRSLIKQAREDSLRNLLKIIDRWSEDRRLHDFFEDITTRAGDMSDEAREEILLKVQEAKNLRASSDSIGSLLAWEAPPPKPPE